MLYISSDTPAIRRGAIYGIGLAYAGSNREDIITILIDAICEDGDAEMTTDDKTTEIPSKKLNANANNEVQRETEILEHVDFCGKVKILESQLPLYWPLRRWPAVSSAWAPATRR